MNNFKTEFQKDLDYFLNKNYPDDFEFIKSGEKELTDKMKNEYIKHFIKRKSKLACDKCKSCKQYVSHNATKQGCFGDRQECEEYEA